jgi:membrane protein DedA with SNARE-associated domain
MLFPLQEIAQWIFLYKYLVLFPVMVIEGPIVTVIAGFFVSLGRLDGLSTFMVLVAGDVTGDSLYYAIGRWCNVARWGRFQRLTQRQTKKLETYFHHHKVKTLLAGKWSHAIGAPILAAAGLARVPYGQFLAVNLLATLPKTLLLLLIGFYFGRGYTSIATYLDYTAIGMIVLAFLLVVIWILMKMFSRCFWDKD